MLLRPLHRVLVWLLRPQHYPLLLLVAQHPLVPQHHQEAIASDALIARNALCVNSANSANKRPVANARLLF